MIELHTCKGMAKLANGRVQFYCTACHKFVKVEERRSEFGAEGRAIKENADLPLGLLHRETRGCCGHQTINIYVSNARNRNRFGKSGSY
jgi:hypothetical protein